MKNEFEGFKDDEIYPAKLSASGINAYYVSDCELAGHRPAYCVCVNKVQAHARDGGLRNSDCDAPIRNGVCIAVRMRNAELSAERAVYFIHRDKLRAFTDAQRSAALAPVNSTSKGRRAISPAYLLAQQSIAAANAVATKVYDAPTGAKEDLVKSIPSRKSSVIDSFVSTDYAAVINAEMKKVENSAAPVVSVVRVEAKLGESPLEMARRMMGQSKTA